VAPAPALDPADAAAVDEMTARLMRTGYAFSESRVPIQNLPAEVASAGADAEVTYTSVKPPLAVVLLVLKDPATVSTVASTLAKSPVPSSTWVAAQWKGRGEIALVMNLGATTDTAPAQRVLDTLQE
jgi:hypothetical protein